MNTQKATITQEATIKRFFSPESGAAVMYSIPPYQRAYAWGEGNWKQLLTDLYETLNSNSPYFFGNILLEDTTPPAATDKKYEIIDGQQRITTIQILLRSLLNVLADTQYETAYFKDKSSYKLKVVAYDEVYYDALISDNKDRGETLSSPSRKKIKGAKDYFEKEFDKKIKEEKGREFLQKLLEKVENTELWATYFWGKKSAALMFELQNDRGEDLTNMERLKAYIMYQLYLNVSSDRLDEQIGKIEKAFGVIYGVFNDITLIRDENDILRYHCQAYGGRGYYYDISGLKHFKEDLKKIESPQQKEEWMLAFVQELSASFQHIKAWQGLNLPYWENLKECGISAFVYPILLKGYKCNNENRDALNQLCRLMEVLCFRQKITPHKGNTKIIRNDRLGGMLINFDGNIAALKERLEKSNGCNLWSDERLINRLYLKWDKNTHNRLKYLFRRYEESLSKKGYETTVTDPEIEHIAPQTYPSERPSGYEQKGEQTDYSQEFKEKYLYNLGNLAMISKAHNLENSNNSFGKKLVSYKESPCFQHKELASFIADKNDPLWDGAAIDKRREKILDFVKKEWSFNF